MPNNKCRDARATYNVYSGGRPGYSITISCSCGHEHERSSGSGNVPQGKVFAACPSCNLPFWITAINFRIVVLPTAEKPTPWYGAIKPCSAVRNGTDTDWTRFLSARGAEYVTETIDGETVETLTVDGYIIAERTTANGVATIRINDAITLTF
jgi:hypothetical protein